MSSILSWKRPIGIAVVVGAACSTLQAASPVMDAGASLRTAGTRVTTLTVPAPVRAQSNLAFTSDLRSVRFTAENLRSDIDRNAPALLARSDGEVASSLEPWSLIAGALGVMVFVARRRRLE